MVKSELRSLLALPAKLADVISLHHLSAYSCRQLRSLPPDLCRLPNLHRVCFDGCTQLGHEPQVGKQGAGRARRFWLHRRAARPCVTAPPPPFSYRTVMREALRELEMVRRGLAPDNVPEAADAALTQAMANSHRRPHRRTPWVLVEGTRHRRSCGGGRIAAAAAGWPHTHTKVVRCKWHRCGRQRGRWRRPWRRRGRRQPRRRARARLVVVTDLGPGYCWRLT